MSKSPDLRAELTKAWRLLTAPLRRLPDFILPGAPKCGTSSLFDLVALHPDVRRGWKKEPTNFIHYPTSVLRSRMNQPFASGRFLCGEGSVEYFFHPDAAGHCASIVPEARIIFMLRDPVARAWSEYRMFVKSGHEKEDFGVVVRRAMQWLSDPDKAPLCESALRSSFNPIRYVCCGMYAAMMEKWLRCFPRDRVLIVFSEDYFERPAVVCRKVYEFLKLRDFQPDSYPHARDSGNRSRPEPEISAELRAFYAPYDKALRLLVDNPLPWDDAQT